MAGLCVQLLRSGRSDQLKATAGSALGRLLRTSPALMPIVLQQGGLQLFRDGITEATRIQVHSRVPCPVLTVHTTLRYSKTSSGSESLLTTVLTTCEGSTGCSLGCQAQRA